MSADAANHGTGRDSRNPTPAGIGQSSSHGPHKGLVPVSENVEGESVLGSIQAGNSHAHLCPDCDQLWRCVCSDGWKVSYARCGCRPVVVAEPVPSRDLAAENAHLRALLRTSLPLLADWPFLRGASFRRDLTVRIRKAVGL